ncbi:MAG: multidrug transporter [Deltaproteobacteria bacterium HGW-Deltaproteobacteria-8]|jgi:multidrug efflux system outer membrane protein|nr:MAG: multidrug transporter [Deltaproteobacteria bacterium HGW-Deltaproteobacteria-8]
MRRTAHALTALGLAFVLAAPLAGCSMAPKYERPQPQLPLGWTSGVSDQTPAQANATLADWRQVIVDEPMKRVVELALANNRDLRVAALKIEKTQAQYRIARADLLPKINATAGANMSRTPGTLTGTGFPATTRAYSVGLGFSSFELDLFGRIQSLKDAALEEYLATESAHRSVELSLVAEVSMAYMTLAADREQLALAQEILATEQDSYEVIRQRFEFGVANELDLTRAQTTVDTARVQVAKNTAQVTADENLLAVLVGVPLSPELLPAKSLAEVAPLAPVPAGLPSEVLTRRPDVLSAEHQLQSANANIGAARARHFPSIGITGSFGTASNAVNGLFTSGAGAWSFAPQITLPIFQAGAISAGVKVAEADRDILVAQYEKTVQTAFREVSDCLALAASLNSQVQAQGSLAQATGKSYELSGLRYDAGVDGFLSKLDAQRSFATARQNLITVNLSQRNNQLTLYKALGGGWSAKAE